MLKPLLWGVTLMTMAWLGPPPVLAQGLFGSGGALSTTSTSNGASSSTGRSSSLISGTSTTGSGTSGTANGSMMSGSGNAGNGANGTSQNSSLLKSSLNAGDGSLGATVGTSGFVGRGDTTGRFVGSQNAQMQNRGGTAAQQLSQLQSLLGNDPNLQQNTTQIQRIRPQLRLGFEAPQVSSTQLQTTVQSRLIAVPQLGTRTAAVAATADGQGLVTLRGSVASEDDRRLVETLVRMEPGVTGVQNELLIAPAATVR